MIGAIRSTALALLLGAMPFGGSVMHGYAARYDPGVFEQVRANRGMPHADCYIASDRHPLGALVRIEGVRTGVWRIAQVTDMSAPKDKARHLRSGLVELDYACARAICGHVSEPWRECPVIVRGA